MDVEGKLWSFIWCRETMFTCLSALILREQVGLKIYAVKILISLFAVKIPRHSWFLIEVCVIDWTLLLLEGCSALKPFKLQQGRRENQCFTLLELDCSAVKSLWAQRNWEFENNGDVVHMILVYSGNWQKVSVLTKGNKTPSHYRFPR